MTAIVLTPDQYATILDRIEELERKLKELEKKDAKTTPIDPLLTVEEVARRLRVSTKSVYRRIRERKINAFLLSGKSYGIRQSEIDKYLTR